MGFLESAGKSYRRSRPKPSGGPSSRPDGSLWPLYHHAKAHGWRDDGTLQPLSARQIAERRQASIEALRRRIKKRKKSMPRRCAGRYAARSVRVGQPSIPASKGFPDARALVDADGAMIVPMRDCLSRKPFGVQKIA